MVFELINLETVIQENKDSEVSPIMRSIRLKKIAPYLGSQVLHSNGWLKSGFNPNLFVQRGEFNIDEFVSQRIFWNYTNMLSGDSPYVFKKEGLFICNQYCDRNTGALTGRFRSAVSEYKHPFFTVAGLYKKHNILSRNPQNLFLTKNVGGKITFFENFLRDIELERVEDAKPADDKTRLSLLEEQYEQHVLAYAMGLSPKDF